MLTTKLTDWKLNAYHPYVPILCRSVETGGTLGGILHQMDAKVPGSIYADLRRAGVIPDPYVDCNSLACSWVKDYWWMYETAFRLDGGLRGRRIRLRLEGIDYKAHISVNGRKLCDHEGAFIPCVVDVTDVARFDEENQITVTLENAPDEMGQIGLTSKVRHYKPRFTYRWDFAPRLVGIGLYDEVTVEDYGPAAIEDAYIRPVRRETGWEIVCDAELTAFDEGEAVLYARAELEGGLVAERRLPCRLREGENALSCALPIEEPRLWWPNGHGDQPLYTVTLTLERDGRPSDRKVYQTGLRTLEYRRCEGAGDDALPYLPVINGKPIYIKGVNMVPMDMMHGCVSAERVRETLEAVQHAGCNLVRVWGGGVIESESFYAQCDRLGIMVFQDFLQSSSGIDDVPSKNPHFLRMLRASSEHAIKTRRNHSSLAFWSGGNELRRTAGEDTPAAYDDENIGMLRALALRWNPEVLMLPTCASGPREFLSVKEPGRNHDVHGPWRYAHEDCEYHELYNRSDSQLHSEFGVDGMANLPALREFLSPENQGVFTVSENVVWRHHAEWWETLERDQHLFGPFGREELEAYVACSQFLQYEGIRYALEANRRRAFRNCGSILWQFNEPWPNISCTNVWDYYGRPKAAYYAVRQAYRPVTPTLRYDSLVLRPGREAVFAMAICSDEEEQEGVLQVTAELDERVLSEKRARLHSRPNGVTPAGLIPVTPDATGNLLITLSWETETACVTSRYPFFVLREGEAADRRFAQDFCAQLRELSDENTEKETRERRRPA